MARTRPPDPDAVQAKYSVLERRRNLAMLRAFAGTAVVMVGFFVWEANDYAGIDPGLAGFVFLGLMGFTVLFHIPAYKLQDRMQKHQESVTRLHDRLIDVLDTELEDRLAAAAQRLHETTEELAELQLITARRAKAVEVAQARAAAARAHAADDQQLANDTREELKVWERLEERHLRRIRRGLTRGQVVLLLLGAVLGVMGQAVWDLLT